MLYPKSLGPGWAFHIKSRSPLLLKFENPPEPTGMNELNSFTMKIQAWDVMTHVYNSNIQEVEAER